MKSESDTEESVLIPNNLTREAMREFIMSHVEETSISMIDKSYNRECTQAMAEIERQFQTYSVAMIDKHHLKPISNYIEELEHKIYLLEREHND
jgi:hypothetical protein